jgi:hypothetical protein
MRYTTNQLSNMTDMEYDIFTRNADYSRNEDDWKTFEEFWEKYIHDMENYRPIILNLHDKRGA